MIVETGQERSRLWECISWLFSLLDVNVMRCSLSYRKLWDSKLADPSSR